MTAPAPNVFGAVRDEDEPVAERVDDPADPRLAEYVDLRDPDLRRRVEPDGGFFIAESPHVIRTVIGVGHRVRSVLVTPVQHDALAPTLATIAAPVYVAEPAVLRRVVGFDLHRGAVASVDRWPLPNAPALCASARRVAVLERVNDHENLGVLFRNAAAFGLEAVLLDAECSDPLYRRTVRVSIGHVCTVPWARFTNLDEVRETGLALVALDARPGRDPDRRGRVAGAVRADARCRGPGPVRRHARGRRSRGAYPDPERRRLAQRGDRGGDRVPRVALIPSPRWCRR